MPKAKLSQIATTWVDEEDSSKKKELIKEKNTKKIIKGQEDQPKKKQTFSLKLGTIKRLWTHRVKTSRTISETIDELVNKHIPE